MAEVTRILRTVNAGPLTCYLGEADTPTLLFVPNQAHPLHYHIELTNEQAKRLRDWLAMVIA
jgi:hypothetical protein